jgi:hypothetical protein
MKDSDYLKLIELVNVGGGFMPANENASELLEQSTKGEILQFNEVTQRDVSFHRCYFSLIGYIYDYLPKHFKSQVKKDDFYIFLKHLKGNYKVLFEFKDGTRMVEYDSLSFGRMSQKSFETYIKDQLPWIYQEVIAPFYEGAIYDGIIENIENEFRNYLRKLG